jgi:hypothetical protein
MRNNPANEESRYNRSSNVPNYSETDSNASLVTENLDNRREGFKSLIMDGASALIVAGFIVSTTCGAVSGKGTNLTPLDIAVRGTLCLMGTGTAATFYRRGMRIIRSERQEIDQAQEGRTKRDRCISIT